MSTPVPATGAAARALAIGVTLGLLAACAPVRLRQTPQALAAQQLRESRLAAQNNWHLTAHIAVSNGHDGGSGQLDWQQNGAQFRFVVHAPVSGRTWELYGDAEHAVLEGVDAQADVATDAQQLLHERLGWEVPLADLGDWIRGMRAPGRPATLRYDAADLPALLVQDGWTVEFRDWFVNRDPPLPRKVFARKGSAHVRVAIQDWSLHE